jgi:simple sugar transport system ATP-binding protein
MVGRPVLLRVEKAPAHPGQTLLRVQDLTVDDDRRNVAVNGVDLEIRAGEIVGLAGVEGNGQEELVEASGT